MFFIYPQKKFISKTLKSEKELKNGKVVSKANSDSNNLRADSMDERLRAVVFLQTFDLNPSEDAAALAFHQALRVGYQTAI